jgi:hypothetical protein
MIEIEKWESRQGEDHRTVWKCDFGGKDKRDRQSTGSLSFWSGRL